MGSRSATLSAAVSLLSPVAVALSEPAQLSRALTDEGRQWGQAVLPFPSG